jgi:NAD dependent epimerase/dehydratase family enzyme
MHIILTGATGLVGSAALLGLMGMKSVTKISVLSRRPVPMLEGIQNDRVEVIIHKDFSKYDSQLIERLKDANGCVWALGISQTAVPKE